MAQASNTLFGAENKNCCIGCAGTPLILTLLILNDGRRAELDLPLIFGASRVDSAAENVNSVS
jgi:hypothetical protein